MTSSIDGTFYNFSVTRIVSMICAKNYEKLSKFVKVMAKILSVLFSGHGVVDIQVTEGSEGKKCTRKMYGRRGLPRVTLIGAVFLDTVYILL